MYTKRSVGKNGHVAHPWIQLSCMFKGHIQSICTTFTRFHGQFITFWTKTSLTHDTVTCQISVTPISQSRSNKTAPSRKILSHASEAFLPWDIKFKQYFRTGLFIVGISWKLVESQTKPSEFQVTKRSLFNAVQSRLQDAKKTFAKQLFF